MIVEHLLNWLIYYNYNQNLHQLIGEHLLVMLIDYNYNKNPHQLIEVLTVKWTKGIGNHSHTYPSGEGTFYVNAIVK